jgi:hypothetical protein
MKHLLDFSKYIKENIETGVQSLKDWAFEYAKENNDGFNNYEDALEELEYLLSEPFPDGLIDMPEKVILFRLLEIEEGEEVNIENLGVHFVAYEELHYDEGFINMIGLSKNSDNNFYIVTIETPSSNIDMKNTIAARLDYPREFEFTLKDDTMVEVKNIKMIDK